MNKPNSNSESRITAKKDYGNLLCLILFVSLGLSSLMAHQEYDALTWFLLGTPFALMYNSPGLAGKNWKSPRTLVSIFLLLMGLGLLIAKIGIDFASSGHPQ